VILSGELIDIESGEWFINISVNSGDPEFPDISMAIK
jgi:hypothetical protein